MALPALPFEGFLLAFFVCGCFFVFFWGPRIYIYIYVYVSFLRIVFFFCDFGVLSCDRVEGSLSMS